MKAYLFDENTKEYIGEIEAQIDPLESQIKGEEVYLLPANSIFTPPLEEKDGFKVIFNGDEWIYEEIPLEVIPEPTVDELQAEVRAVRNSYLEKYVDPKQLVMVWDGLSIDERNTYAEYRKYLLDYTESDEWWLENPLTLDEWLLIGTDEVVVSEIETVDIVD